jgi:adenylate kinase family enzyme
MRILALAERALDNDALLRLLYSRSLRSRSNDSEENAIRERWKKFQKEKQNLLEIYTENFS